MEGAGVAVLNILLWHVHGSWTTSFVQGAHRYLIPVVSDRGPDGRGRAQTWEWPTSVVEVTRDEARDVPIDVVVLQRPSELFELVEGWLGRAPGRDVPAVYLEHSAPQGRINDMRHPAADRGDLLLVHVTHFNDLFWDAGSTETTVVEHGIVDPGYRYTGQLERAAVVINEPVRRGRVTGTDLLDEFRSVVPIDLFGMKVRALGGIEDLPQDSLHDEMARRRAYFHPIRWTSLGMSLIEAMFLGMPVVALSTTEASEVLPQEAAIVSNQRTLLRDALRSLMGDPERARVMGKHARDAALSRFRLTRFLADWDSVFERVVR
jgi:glycosyltransferase involved in cell wall biosynthesis